MNFLQTLSWHLVFRRLIKGLSINYAIFCTFSIEMYYLHNCSIPWVKFLECIFKLFHLLIRGWMKGLSQLFKYCCLSIQKDFSKFQCSDVMEMERVSLLVGGGKNLNSTFSFIFTPRRLLRMGYCCHSTCTSLCVSRPSVRLIFGIITLLVLVDFFFLSSGPATPFFDPFSSK